MSSLFFFLHYSEVVPSISTLRKNMIIECVDTNPSSAEVWRILFPDCCDGIFSSRPTKKEDDRINGHVVRAK